jgi:hypothetical protein
MRAFLCLWWDYRGSIDDERISEQAAKQKKCRNLKQEVLGPNGNGLLSEVRHFLEGFLCPVTGSESASL